MKRIGLYMAALFFVVAFEKQADSYANSIGYGYTKCLQCHFNPYGNGPLRDFGRRKSASVISSKALFGPNASDKEIESTSGFLGTKKLPSWLRLSADFRAQYEMRSFNTEQSESEIVPLIADGSVILKSPRDRFYIVATLGYFFDNGKNALEESSLAATEEEKAVLISREHYMGVRFNKVSLAAGLSDTVFGIRMPEYFSASRAYTGLSIDDQTHGIFGLYSSDSFQFGGHYFLGNMLQEEEKRQAGFSGKAEFYIGKRALIGASYLASENAFRSRKMYAGHLKWGFGNGSSLLAEAGKVTELISGLEANTSYAFIQNGFVLSGGWSIMANFEYLERKDIATGNTIPTTIKIGPTIQYIPFQRLELRLDVNSVNPIGSKTFERSSIDAALQAHIWL